MITRGNILSTFESSRITNKEKERIIHKKSKTLTKYLKEKNSVELLEYLFNSKIPKNLKVLVAQIINERTHNHEELEKIEKYFQKHLIFKENDLYKKSYPNILKSYIIKTIYDNDIITVLNSNKKATELKKYIIDNGTNYENIPEILTNIKDDELKKYILETKLTDIKNLEKCLNNVQNSTELEEYLIKRYINETNILELLGYPLRDEIKNRIINFKTNELTNCINTLSEKEIIKLIISVDTYPKSVYDALIKYQKENLEKIINEMSFDEFRKTLSKVKDIRIANIFITNHPLKTKLSLLFTKKISVLTWLYNDSIPYEIKSFIIKNKKKELKNAILNRTINNLKLCYLRKTENIPSEIPKLIIELKKEELIKDLQKKPEDIIISEIMFGKYCDDYKKFIINNTFNKDSLKKLISRSDDELINLIFESSEALIEKIIITMPIIELMNLTYFENDYAKILAVTKYKTLILNRIKKIEKEEIYKYLKDYNTHREIKKIILKTLKIDENDLDNTIELIKYNDTKKTLENFNKIKIFIEKASISFDAFIEYGCGSENYKNWFNKILEIINTKHEDDFYKALNYLMNKLYFEDLSKENMVYTIIDFMEILSVFNNNYELIMNLTNNEVLLDKESKTNLKYLFASSLEQTQNIKNLEDLKLARVKILEQYKDIIKNTTSIDELKNIFKNVIFKNSNTTLDYIGGTQTLISLKKSNKANEKICLYIDNLIKCTRLIEMIENTNNIESIRKILKYFVIENPDKLSIIESTYARLKKDIQTLFELDAKINLSDLENAKKLGLLNSELSQKYGGEVYDFRNVNYCLYAHVLSNFEKIEMLVNGKATSNKNFMSVSPISYLGQKYYFDRTGTTLAIDKIPTGSFICSSLSNMSTNYNISNNSAEVKEIKRTERGILETSAVTKLNSEVLLYREGVKVSGIILPDNREPSEEEKKYHEEYNLPYIITQKIMTPIANVKKVFTLNDINIDIEPLPKELEAIFDILTKIIYINKSSSIYTGQEIALITDAHALYEPTLAVLEDIKKNNIKEIYSLGDNIGEGPNPHEVMELLEKYNVTSIAGNSEYYNILGTEPFTYFDDAKRENQSWTYDKLSTSDLNILKSYKPSIDLEIGNKKVGLCHFANDIRWDYLGNNSTWSYQKNFKKGITSKQFLYTNSEAAKNKIEKTIKDKNLTEQEVKGLIDALKSPLFNGKNVTDYDAIIEGHVHFHLDDYVQNTTITTLRAIGMGYSKEDKDCACYYVIKEKNDGTFDIEKRLVNFNRNILLANIMSSDIPHKAKILKFVKR